MTIDLLESEQRKVVVSLFSPHNPDIIAQEIVDDLEAAQEQFRLIANDLEGSGVGEDNDKRESLDILIAYCQESNRVCPMPDKWNDL